MFVLFVIGVSIGISFAFIYTQYQTIAIDRSHKVHLDRLHAVYEDDPIHGENQAVEDVHSIENRTLASRLYAEVRILCWILTTPKNHEKRAVHVKNTWGKRCNKLLFMSTEHDKSIDSIALNVSVDSPSTTWGKTKRAFQYIYQHHRTDADWFLKAEDDTYVILENLRYFLYGYSTNDPIYFGYKVDKPDVLKHGFFLGGAGYVLSQNALHRFSEAIATNPNCRQSDKGFEDLELGKCMESVGVLAGDTRDEMKRGRFFFNSPEHHLIPGKIDKSNWYWKNQWYKSNEGFDCCSDNAISFHRIAKDQMYSLEYLIYHLRPYGVVAYSQPLPKKVNFSEIVAQLIDESPPVQSNLLN